MINPISTSELKHDIDINRLIGRNLYSNAIINGNLLIDQYSTADGTSLASSTYPIDMFKTLDNVVTSPKFYKLTTSQPVLLPESNSIKLIAQATESTKYIMFGQQIEDYKQFYSKEITLSCWVKSNTINTRLLIYDGSTYTGSTTHTGSGAWELLTVTRTMGSAITSLIGRVGMVTATGTGVNITNTDYVEFTGMQLCLGNKRLPENPLSYADELAKCQRYYQLLLKGTSKGMIVGTTQSVTAFYSVFIAIVAMNHTPTLIVSNVTDFNIFSGTIFGVTNITLNVSQSSSLLFEIVWASSGMTIGNAGWIRSIGSGTPIIALDANL